MLRENVKLWRNKPEAFSQLQSGNLNVTDERYSSTCAAFSHILLSLPQYFLVV